MMKPIYRRLVNINGEIMFQEIEESQIEVPWRSRISIDGSTSNTGAAILRDDGAVLYSMAFSRDDKKESPIRYKLELKGRIKAILEKNRAVMKSFYEEPVLDNVTSIPALMMLRTFIDEMKIENEPEFDYLTHSEVNNKKWKKTVLGPDVKLAGNTEGEKRQVMEALLRMLPCASVLTEDEMDAIMMGVATVMYERDGRDSGDLASQKAIRPFKYNCEFIGADGDDYMFEEFSDIKGIPQKVLANGIMVTELNGREKFDKMVYRCMGDEDMVVILKYPSSKYGNITLKYELGGLVSQFDYIYAVVWRKSRH